MPNKTLQLQIRVTAKQKALLKRRAAAAGIDMSTYVLARALADDSDRFASLVRQLANDSDHRYVLAELNDFLSACAPVDFRKATDHAHLTALSPLLQNYVAAMVEQAAEQKGVAPPVWVRTIAPLDEPHFATPLASLRMYLLRAAPVPFKRRNIFVDAGVGARV